MIIRQMKNLVGKEPGLEEKGEEFWLTLYLQYFPHGLTIVALVAGSFQHRFGML